jgi:hypothetical protein
MGWGISILEDIEKVLPPTPTNPRKAPRRHIFDRDGVGTSSSIYQWRGRINEWQRRPYIFDEWTRAERAPGVLPNIYGNLSTGTERSSVANRQDSHPNGSYTVWLSVMLANVSDGGENTLRKIQAGPAFFDCGLGLALPEED